MKEFLFNNQITRDRQINIQEQRGGVEKKRKNAKKKKKNFSLKQNKKITKCVFWCTSFPRYRG